MLPSPGGLLGSQRSCSSPEDPLQTRAHGQSESVPELPAPELRWLRGRQTLAKARKVGKARSVFSFLDLRMLWLEWLFLVQAGRVILREQSKAVPGGGFKLVSRGRTLTNPQVFFFPSSSSLHFPQFQII